MIIRLLLLVSFVGWFFFAFADHTPRVVAQTGNTTSTASTLTTTITSTSTSSTTLEPPPPCGDPTDDGVTTTDALFTLRAAVGLETCLECVCDVDGSGSVAVTDALIILSLAVGNTPALNCPGCTS